MCSQTDTNQRMAIHLLFCLTSACYQVPWLISVGAASWASLPLPDLGGWCLHNCGCQSPLCLWNCWCSSGTVRLPRPNVVHWYMGESLRNSQKGRCGLADGSWEHQWISHARNIGIPGKVERFNMCSNGKRWPKPDYQIQSDIDIFLFQLKLAVASSRSWLREMKAEPEFSRSWPLGRALSKAYWARA